MPVRFLVLGLLLVASNLVLTVWWHNSSTWRTSTRRHPRSRAAMYDGYAGGWLGQSRLE